MFIRGTRGALEPCYVQGMLFAIANRIRFSGPESELYTPYQNNLTTRLYLPFALLDIYHAEDSEAWFRGLALRTGLL